MKHNFKRILAVLLALCMLIPLLPTTVFAAAGDTTAAKAIVGSTVNEGTFFETFPEQDITFTEQSDGTLVSGALDVEDNIESYYNYLTYDSAVAKVYVKNGEKYSEVSNATYDGTEKKITLPSGTDMSETFYVAYKYIKKDYDISFGTVQYNGKSFNNMIPVPAVPAAADRYGLGWRQVGKTVIYTAGNSYSVKDFEISATDTTLTFEPVYIAISNAEVYQVTFKDTDGKIYNVQSVDSAGKAQAPADPTRAGYTFKGWNDGTTTYAAANLPAITAATVYTAVWEAVKYDVAVEEPSSDFVAADATQATVGQTVTAVITEEEGYETHYLVAMAYNPTSGDYDIAIPVTRTDLEPSTATATWQFTMPAANVMLYDAYTESIFEIQFKDGDDLMSLQNVATAGSPVEPALEKDGYELDGWTDGINTYGPGDVPAAAADVVYTAIWKAKELSVTYDSVNYTLEVLNAANAGKLQIGDTVSLTLKNAAIQEGRGMLVVDENKQIVPVTNLSGEIFVFTMPGTNVTAGPATYYKTFDINFYSDGVVVDVQSVMATAAVTAPTVTKPGYTLTGWTDGTTTYAVGAIPVATAAASYTAVWTAIDYNVNVEAAVSTSVTPDKTTATVGQTVNVTVDENNGYDAPYIIVLAWNAATNAYDIAVSVTRVDPSPSDQEGIWRFTMPAADVLVDVAYTEYIYEYRFYDGNSLVSQQHVPFGNKAVEPLLTKAGYTLTGWTGNGTTYTIGTVPEATGDLTLAAVWEAVEYNISADNTKFDVSHAGTKLTVGTLVTVTVKDSDSDTLNYIYVLGADNTPIPVSRVADKTYQFVMPANNVNIIGQFVTNIYDVTFRSDDSLVSLQAVAHNAKPTEPRPVKTGYTLVGWNDGTTTYNTGDLPAVTADVVFTAVWEINRHNIVVAEHADGIVLPAVNTASFGQIVNVTIEEMDGYDTQFLIAMAFNHATGRYDIAVPVVRTDVNPTTSEANWQFVMPDASVILDDAYTTHIYEIQFVNDGNVISLQNVMAYMQPAEPTLAKPGYTFIGWTDGFTTYDAADLPRAEEDVTYTAVWEADDLNLIYDTAKLTTTYSSTDGLLHVGSKVDVTINDSDSETLNYIYVVDADGFMVPVSRVGEKTYRFTMPATDATITGVFVTNVYDVTFRRDDSLVSLQAIAHGEKPVEPILVKTGFTLTGWTDGTNTYDVGALPAITADVIFTAAWEANEYSISIHEDAEGYVFPQVETATAGQTVNVAIDEEYGYDTHYLIVLALNPVTELYDIAVPVTRLDLSPSTEEATWQFTMPAADVEVNEAYTTHIFDVQFSDGEELISHQSIAYDDFAVEPATPVKLGYTFTGWMDQNNNVFAAGELPVVSEDVIYTAQWEALVYDITVVDGDHSEATVSAEQGSINDMIDIDVTFDEGYEGYYLFVETATGLPVAISRIAPDTFRFVMPAEDVTVTVVDTAIVNTVTYIENGNTFAFQYVPSGDVPNPPQPPVKEGYTFTGWLSSEGDFYTPGDAFEAIYHDTSYTATYEINKHDFNYYRGEEADNSEYKCILILPDGSMVEFFNNDTVNMPTYTLHDVTYGEDIVLGDAMLPGYKLVGWVDEGNHFMFVGESFTMPDRDVIVTAVWEADELATALVRFTIDGELYNAFLAYDTEMRNIPATDPHQDGKIFVGWEYDGEIYANDGVSVFEVVAGEDRDMELTAVFEDETYTLTLTGDTIDFPAKTDLAYGEEVVLPEAPERPGYTFVAWVDLSNGAYYGENGLYTVKHDSILSAIWTKDNVTYAVRFFDEFGALYTIELVAEGESVTAPAYGLAKPGCTYLWTNDILHYAEGADVTPTENLDLFATKIEETRYTVHTNIYPNTIDSGTVSIDGASYLAGETVYVNITIPEGYSLKNVSAVGDDEMTPVVSGLLTFIPGAALFLFEMPYSDVTVSVEFEQLPQDMVAVRFMNEGDLYDAFQAYIGESYEIPAVDPAEAGRIFAGWEYEGEIYSNDGVSSFLAEEANPTGMIFTAVWEEESYELHFRGPSSGNIDMLELTYGQEIVLPEPLENEGYTFIGWQDTTNNAIYDANSLYIVNHSAGMVALWMRNEVSHLVKFYNENGNLYDFAIVPEGESILAPVYGDAQVGCTYLWMGENIHYAEGDLIIPTEDMSLTATKTSEKQYNVSVIVKPEDISSANAVIENDKYFAGETGTVEIHIPEGYMLKNVTAVGTDGETEVPVKDSLLTFMPNAAMYYFEMPACDISVFVEFVKIPAGKTGVKFMVDGTLVDLVVVTKGENGTAPDFIPEKDGYEFIYWQSGNTIVDAGDAFPVAADAPDEITFVAVFDQNSYTISYDSLGGTPQPEPESHAYGEQITLASAPEKFGFKFVGWTEEATGFLYSAGASYKVDGNAKFTALWVAESCVVRFIDPMTGIIYGYETIEKGETVIAPDASAVPNMTFVEWVNAADYADVVRANGRTRPIYVDTIYFASYNINMHGINVQAEQCTVNILANGPIEVGDDVTFTVTPNPGYKVDSVTLIYRDDLSMVVRELSADAAGNYSFVMPDADVTIIAKAIQNVFSVFTETDDHVNISAPTKAEVGTNVLAYITVTDPDYVLKNVCVATEDGTIIPVTRLEQDGRIIYVFVMPASDVTIYADTVPAEYTVTYLDSDNTLLGIVPVDSGENADAPVASKDGYTFDHWEILPVSDPALVFDPANDTVTENLVVRAVYVGDAHTVEAGLIENVEALRAECVVSSGNRNSSDLLQSALNAETGKAVSFVVAAKFDYVITGVAITGLNGSETIIEPNLRLKETIDGINYYTVTFMMPAEDVKIDVYTVAKLFTVNVEETEDAQGDYRLNGFNTNNLLCPQGSNVTINIAPIDGYIVKEVIATFVDRNSIISHVDGTLNEDNTLFTFKMVPYAVTISIVYAPIEYTIDIQTSNFESYKPDTSVNPAVVIESLDENLTSKGLIVIDGVDDVDYTNDLNQIYKIPNNGIAIVGDHVSFSVIEYTGYDLASVTVTYADGEKTCPLTFKDGKYFFEMPADEVTITAIFVEETYTVSKDTESEIHGDVQINGLNETAIAADYKDIVDVTVTPDAGYRITNIYYVLADGTVLDFDEASYAPDTVIQDALDTVQGITFHMPASDVTVYVEYAAIDYSISDVTAAADVVYTTPHTVGEQVTFTTEANYGYVITKVYVVNDTTGERVAIHEESTSSIYGDSYTFTMPASSVTIHVETIEDVFTVIYLVNGKVIDLESIDYLDEATVAEHVAMVNDAPVGYHFVGWSSEQVETPVADASVDNADFVIVENRTYIVAVFEKDEIDVVFEPTMNGTVTENSTGNDAPYRLDTTVFGDTVTFDAIPAAGYVVDEVTILSTDSEGYINNIRYTVDGDTYSFRIPATYKETVHEIQAEDIIVTVTFKRDTFTSHLTVIGEGTTAINGYDTDNFDSLYLDTVSITANPAEGWMLSSIVVDGGAITVNEAIVAEGGVYTFTMPDHDVEVVVTFVKIHYDVTTPDVNGTVVAVPDTDVTIGDQVQVTAVPDEGYHLDYIYATGDESGNEITLTKVDAENYYFLMPAESVTVTAVFVKNVYTVTFYDWNGDMLSVDYVDFQDAATAPADPAREGYTFIGWDTVFDSVTSDLVVTALYQIITSDISTYSVSFTGVSHGIITVPNGTDAEYGEVVTVICDPDDGFRFESISILAADGHYVNAAFVSQDAEYVTTYSFVMPDCAVEIYICCANYSSSYFTDVRTDDWSYEAVQFVSDRGYFYGVSDTLFAPRINMTRGMFAAVLARINGINAADYTGTAFSDVPETAYYAAAIKWASDNGIVEGYNAATYGPDDPITREQMASIMYRYCKYIGCDMTLINQDFMNRYSDLGTISDWAVEPVEWAVGVGLILGRSHTTIDPVDLATRAEVAQIIKNLCDKILFE